MSARNVPPVNVLFLYMERQLRVNIWLAERRDITLQGVIKGFDEFMNIVLQDVQEIDAKLGTTRSYKKLMLKGDCISLISSNA